MNDLTIDLRAFKRLAESVIPFASNDVGLPSLNAVNFETRGEYLLATATDRFRLVCKRLKAPEGGTWPEWSALLPVSTLKAIFQTYKAQRFSVDPLLTLTIDGEALRVHGDTALVDLLDASVTYPIVNGEFPKVGKLFRDALADEGQASNVAVNPKFLATYANCTSEPSLAMRVTDPTKPILFADGQDFLGLLMPRKRFDSSNSSNGFPDVSSWDALLTPPAAKAAPKRTRKAKGTAA